MFSKKFLKVQAMAHAYFVIKIPFSIARNDTSNKWSQVKNDTWKGNYTAKSRYWGGKGSPPTACSTGLFPLDFYSNMEAPHHICTMIKVKHFI